jgi:DNA-binding CsgD family transcriptional regulator
MVRADSLRRDLGLAEREILASRRAREILGDAAPSPDSALAELIAAIADRLEHSGDAVADATAQTRHAEQLDQLRRRVDARVDAFARLESAIARLRTITAPAAMLAAAPQQLCAGSAFRRVVLSSVNEGLMTAESAVFRDDPGGARAALEALRAQPVRLAHPLVETDVMRRAHATAVTDAQRHPRVHAATAETMGWNGYVAAPISVRSTVIALIHADHGAGARVDDDDREVLWAFASGLAQAYERASLRRLLLRERQEIRQFLAWLDGRSGELADAAVALDVQTATFPLDAAAPRRAPTLAAAAEGVVFDGLLTRRELEVMRLLSDGLSNRAIADELVISAGTVKFHVNRILNKLRVANRAEAVSRYYTLLGTRARG